jgi:hypothetical protein
MDIKIIDPQRKYPEYLKNSESEHLIPFKSDE